MPFKNVSTHEWGSFYDDSPVLTGEMVASDYRRWWNDERLDSHVVPVALITPTDEEVALLSDPLFTGMPCRKIAETHPIVVALGGFVAKFRAAVAYEMARSSLTGEHLEHFEAGYYNRDLVPHVDDGKRAVKLMAAIGVGSTVGFTGDICLSETGGIAGLRTDVPSRGASAFEEVRFPEGTVGRIRTFGDVHSWPEGEGTRFYAQSTIYVA